MNTQQLINYEATIQFALGDVLRDLAILMHYAERRQQPDTTTCTQTLHHLSVFQKRLCALEQEVLAVYTSTQEYNNEKALTAQN